MQIEEFSFLQKCKMMFAISLSRFLQGGAERYDAIWNKIVKMTIIVFPLCKSVTCILLNFQGHGKRLQIISPIYICIV
jgi:hypothetical protein